jgi:hypothetical protein
MLLLAKQNPPKLLLQDQLARQRRPLNCDLHFQHRQFSYATAADSNNTSTSSRHQQRRRQLASITQNPYHRGRLKGPNCRSKKIAILNSVLLSPPHNRNHHRRNSQNPSNDRFSDLPNHLIRLPLNLHYYLSTANENETEDPPTAVPSSTLSSPSQNPSESALNTNPHPDSGTP